MKKLVFISIVFLVIYEFSISCKKDNNILSVQNEPITFRVKNYDFTTYKYDKLFVNKVNDYKVNEINGIFIGKSVGYQNGKIISKINKKLFIIHFDNQGSIKNIYRVKAPVFNCDCPDDDNSTNYCEDYVDDKNRLRCRGTVSCCEGYITDDGNEQIKHAIDNGIVVTCNKIIYNNKVYK